MPVREFLDREGVSWHVEWRPGEMRTRVVGGESETLPAGLEFTSDAFTFRWPFSEYTDPRAVRVAVLEDLVERALDGRGPDA